MAFVYNEVLTKDTLAMVRVSVGSLVGQRHLETMRCHVVSQRKGWGPHLILKAFYDSSHFGFKYM